MPHYPDRYSEARDEGTLWTPRQLHADLSTWLDVSRLDQVLVNSGPQVWQINSLVNGHYVEQGGTTPIAAQPKFSRDGMQGLPCMDFDANGQWIATYSQIATMTSDFLAVLVASIRSTSGVNARFVSWSNSNSANTVGSDDWNNANSMALIHRTATDQWGTYQNNGMRATTNGVTDGEVCIFAVESDGTNIQHWHNGKAGGSGTWGSLALSNGKWNIGSYGGSVTNTRGLWGEFLALKNYNALKAAYGGDRLSQMVVGAIAHKRRLAGLLDPAHRYANRPPLNWD